MGFFILAELKVVGFWPTALRLPMLALVLEDTCFALFCVFRHSMTCVALPLSAAYSNMSTLTVNLIASRAGLDLK